MNLLQMSISGAVLILAITLVRMVSLRTLPKHTFLALWMVVLVRLLIPFEPIFHIDLPLPQIQIPSAIVETQGITPAITPTQSEQTAPVRPPQEAETATQGESKLTINTAQSETPAATQTQQAQTRRDVSTATLLTIVWAVGVLLLGAFFTISYTAGYRKFRLALPVDNADARVWMQTHPLKRGLTIKSLRGLDSPMTYGVLHPVILVPQAADWWSGCGVKYSLEHEYVHMRRFDAATKFVMALALTIHWFNPAVWLLYALANRDIELSCDEAVLRRLGETERGSYARALLAAEERRSEMPALYASFGVNTTKERIIEIMKFKKKSVWSIALAALLVLSLAACAAATAEPRAEATDAPTEPLDTPAPAPIGDFPDGAAYLNGGMTLTVPAGYRDLVLVDMPEDDEYGTLFTVSERDSVNAAIGAGHEDWGMGWLFSIERVSKAELDERMTADMSGVSVFAKDEDGNCYIRSTPTDVWYFRNEEAVAEESDGWAQWEMLQRWAGTVRDTFLAENPGLTPFTVTNSGIDIYLARLACWDDVDYTLSSTTYGPLSPNGVDAAPYVARLRDGVTFEGVDLSETPDGEYIVLFFPDSGGGERFDFFAAGGNYVREVYGPNGEYEILYKATYADGANGETQIAHIMQAWYDALAAANGMPSVRTTN